ncbi:YhdP family protein [Pseudoduganella ginsengisoli]|uniref:TIGR02099 family protein n=1 Tax=Pseudoduganella ginsengisoli TaxID=1462440 RepID=A0A6L6Q6Q5_9BURK|nr:YhdP family protein [Pseudoduganella ginsengisoli]MTW04928.1 TIGR02099 family protein [Pseudoduganella ginsengisoli]
MQKTSQLSETGSTPLAVRWQRLRAAYRVANLATHHVLGFTLKLVLALYFAFGLLFLVLRYLVLPNIDHYKPDIEKSASQALGNPVTIDRIYASWTGLYPTLFLGDVHLRDKAGNQVLSLPSVSATLSWWSVAALDVRFRSLELIRPNLDVRRELDGKLYAAGVYIDLDRKGDGKGADWLLMQQEIVIREGRLDWTDQLRAKPTLSLANLNVVLRNQWRRHRLALQATPAQELGGPVDVRADFVHPTFAQRPSDVRLWQGEIYADVQKADLAAWKNHIDYPLDVQSAMGSVRAWVRLDHLKLAAFTADVGLQDVTARLAPDLPALDLEQVQGRISAREEIPAALQSSQPAFGALGHSITLTNFSLKTRDGLVMAPTNLSERFAAATKKSPERMEVSASVLDLQALAALAAHLPLSAQQRQVLADVDPTGKLVDVTATWYGTYPALNAYLVKGRLDHLGMKPRAARLPVPKTAHTPGVRGMPALPGFDGLSGTLEASEKGGKFTLDADQSVLRMPDYFAEGDMPFDRLNGKFSWTFDGNERLKVDVDNLVFAQEGLTGSLTGTHVVPLDGKSAGVADFVGKLDGFDVKKIGRYLPVHTPEHLRQWLTGALEEGRADDVHLRLRGDLAHFPFADKSKGEFKIGGRIHNGRLNYDPGYYAKDGKSPEWPVADKIKGSFLFEGVRMEIRGDTAVTGNVALSNVKAVIPDLSIHDSMLEIDGNAVGAMQDYVNYVAASPVLEWIGHFTDETTSTGNAKLGLSLRLPLANLHDSKVQGVLQLLGNDVVLWHDMPPVLGATGKIEFNEKGVNLNGLSGAFVGGPVAVSGGTQRDGSIQVKLAGAVTTDGLRKTWPVPEVARLAAHFSGSARYSGLVMARDHRYSVTVDSNLAGLGLDFPAPLIKNAADVLPLRVVLTGDAATIVNGSAVMHDDLRIALGSGLSAAYQRQRVGKGPWKMVRGGIGVNTPAPEPDSGLALNANLKSLNVDHWIDLADHIAGKPDPNAPPANPNGSDIAQYVTIDAMAARASELVLGERKLDNVVAGVTNQKGIWQANVESPQAAGYVTWNTSAAGQGIGKVTARLSSLIIPSSSANEVKDLLENKGSQAAIPALDIVAERFELFNKPLGRLELQAYNAPASREWKVSKLTLANADGELKGTGRWVVGKDGQHHSSLNFDLDIINAGKLLDRFGFTDTLRNGKGTLSGDIAWTGLPYAFDIPSLSGQLKMDVAKGQFLKQDPGAAKLLGVLSLQALPRLLKLDFHDVFSEGLAFDGITANAAINHGIVRTENLKMHGVAATVLMAGSADIANETTNLHVVVMPEVNFGTAPLMYALAVNPVVGLGSFLTQLFLSQPLSKALTYEMQVTGPWKAPVITKIDSRKEAKQ